MNLPMCPWLPPISIVPHQPTASVKVTPEPCNKQAAGRNRADRLFWWTLVDIGPGGLGGHYFLASVSQENHFVGSKYFVVTALLQAVWPCSAHFSPFMHMPALCSSFVNLPPFWSSGSCSAHLDRFAGKFRQFSCLLGRSTSQNTENKEKQAWPAQYSMRLTPHQGAPAVVSKS